EATVGVVEAVQRQADLLQIVLAAGALRRLADLLHGRQQQSDQHRNDGDDDEQLDQRERAAVGGTSKHRRTRMWTTARRVGRGWAWPEQSDHGRGGPGK